MSREHDCVEASTADAPTMAGDRPRLAMVAAFRCAELDRLGREVGVPLAVIAATSDPTGHAARLSATRHAGWSPRAYDQWCMPFDDGLVTPRDTEYGQVAFDPRWLGRHGLPAGVRLEGGSLVVGLPRGTCASDLSAVLRAGLAESCYLRVARRPARVRRMWAARLPVVVSPRYALLDPGDIERVAVVEDAFEFRPRGLPRLAVAVALACHALAVGSAMARAVDADADRRRCVPSDGRRDG